MGFPSTISVDPWYLIEFSSSLTIKTIPPRARGALKNEQVSGIIRDYKLIPRKHEAGYAHATILLEHTQIIVQELMPSPIYPIL